MGEEERSVGSPKHSESMTQSACAYSLWGHRVFKSPVKNARLVHVNAQHDDPCLLISTEDTVPHSHVRGRQSCGIVKMSMSDPRHVSTMHIDGDALRDFSVSPHMFARRLVASVTKDKTVKVHVCVCVRVCVIGCWCAFDACARVVHWVVTDVEFGESECGPIVQPRCPRVLM